jgi:Dyp-type peroxidase family
VTVASDWIHKPPAGEPPTHCINIGFTSSGLAALGVAPEHLASFPADFREGARARAASVGDTGRNAPEHWIEELQEDRHDDAHVVLSVYAIDDEVLRKTTTELLEIAAREGAATTIYERDARALYDDDERAGIVHFGYRDGLSQPTIEGVPDYRPADAVRIRDPLAPVPAGDFLVGHPSQRGSFDELPQPPKLARNGSYAAFRIAAQDVAGFERFLAEQADTPEGREMLAAKICGRWRSTGVPLVMAPDAEPHDVPTADLNAFDFAGEHPDPAGLRCPLGSHIRRSNPRRQPDAPGDPQMRRIIRRGMPYGRPYDPENPDDGEERGLVGMFICGNLTEQFEFVMRLWINNGAVSGGVTRDPLTGNIDDAHAQFTAPGDPPLQIDGLPRFVTTRGALYLFLPSMTALQYLAELP